MTTTPAVHAPVSIVQPSYKTPEGQVFKHGDVYLDSHGWTRILVTHKNSLRVRSFAEPYASTPKFVSDVVASLFEAGEQKGAAQDVLDGLPEVSSFEDSWRRQGWLLKDFGAVQGNLTDPAFRAAYRLKGVTKAVRPVAEQKAPADTGPEL